MNRSTRTIVFLLGAVGVGILAVLAITSIPSFGSDFHPYRTPSVKASVAHATANVISSINFDQRGLDTLGEESILFASVLGVATLLRRADDEKETTTLGGVEPLGPTRFFGYVMLPVTILIGFDIIAHGAITPGGGFQGGVIVGTGIHLLYVAGNYPAIKRARPLRPLEWGEAIGAGAFACLGLAGLLVGASFLSEIIPGGTLGDLLSSGTVELLNGAVGVEVASGTAVLLAKFLEQAVTIKADSEQ